MVHVWCPIVELRQYTLRPGQRDVLIDLFDRAFIETQEAVGIAVLGQFRDVDRSDRFVWLRGFSDMVSRADALGRFYGGPVWKARGREANVTMIDSDDVLLLRPVASDVALPPSAVRPAISAPGSSPSTILVTVYLRDAPFDAAFVDFFDRTVRPVLVETGATPLILLQTEYAENTFPALPVREGEHAFVWFARFPNGSLLDDHLNNLDRSEAWRDDVGPALSAEVVGEPQRLRLAPTARSLLR